MKRAIATIQGVSPYSQSRNYLREVPKKEKEGPDAYEERTWRHRSHVNREGYVVIPGTSFANCVKESAKRLAISVPGKGKTLYTKYIEAGVMVPDSMVLPVKGADLPGDTLYVPSDGRAGGPKRVWKTFPRIDEWGGKIAFYIFDDIITPEVFKRVLIGAGQLVGIGRFRPQSRGYYGRFIVPEIEWAEGDDVLDAMVGA